jgi:hypothetical protein
MQTRTTQRRAAVHGMRATMMAAALNFLVGLGSWWWIANHQMLANWAQTTSASQ